MAFIFVDLSLPYSNNRVVKAIIKTLEVIFLSVGLLFTLLMLKVAAAPYFSDAVFSGLVVFWSATRCFSSSPLYICVAINLMIALIAVSSTFHRQENEYRDLDVKVNVVDDLDDARILGSPPPAPPREPPPTITTSKRKGTKLNSIEKQTLPNGTIRTKVLEIEIPLNPLNSSPTDPIDSMVQENLVTTPPHLEKPKEIYSNKESVDTYYHMNDIDDEEDDSIEATWKAITGGGKQRPKKKQLKKSETWDVPPRSAAAIHRLDSEEIMPTTPKWKELRKSETFSEAVSMTRRGGLVRRDPSTSLEEFNQRVEAFIKKFNDEMRLQRQESDQKLSDMINNRGL